jgi:fermentation-respiration switch protein FrsA (DUF1100 family)
VSTAAGFGGAYLFDKTQEKFLFHPTANLVGDPIEPIKDPKDYELEGITASTIKTSKDESLLIWKSTQIDKTKPTLLLFPGSVGHLGDTHMGTDAKAPEKDAYIRIIKEAQARGMQVIAANHVGFASQTDSSPSQDAIYRGAEAVIDLALKYGLTPNQLQITGVSMGTMVASHAASYLSATRDFKDYPDQQIHLNLVSGTISVPHGAADQTPLPKGAAQLLFMGQTFDTAKELNALSGNAGRRAYVAFVRGENDKFTPPYHAAEHKKAAPNVDFKAFVVKGEHFPSPSDILNVVEAKTAGMQTENLSVGKPEKNGAKLVRQ